MFNFFKTDYKRQQLTNKQHELVRRIDNLFVENSDMPTGDQKMMVKMYVVPFHQQLMPLDLIVKQIKNKTAFEGYIPRSVAITSVGADWQVYVGIRSDNMWSDTIDPIVVSMFSDLLTRTNSARTEYEVSQTEA